jgi:hypothetical protein
MHQTRSQGAALLSTSSTTLKPNCEPSIELIWVQFRNQPAANKMGWGLWSSPPPTSGNGDRTANAKRPDASWSTASRSTTLPPLDTLEPAFSSAPTKKKKEISWNESLNREDWDYYKTPRGYILPGLTVGLALGFWVFWRSYLRRLKGAGHITPGYFHKRSLLGKVTSVGDGDGFHLFHTPGGRLAGWGWLRSVPKDRKQLKGRTVSLAGSFVLMKRSLDGHVDFSPDFYPPCWGGRP